MATNRSEIATVIKDLIAAAKADLQRTLGDDNISKNTKHTKCYNLRKEIKRLIVIDGLMSIADGQKFAELCTRDKNFGECISAIVNPEDGGTRVVVKEGDKFMDLVFVTYKDAKDVVARINKAAEAAGLKLDSTTNTFVRA